MPGRDGTGVMGQGAKSGRGLGNCKGANAAVRNGGGLGLGNRRGDPKAVTNSTVSQTQKEMLQEQKELFERRLDSISKQLNNL
ncbi:hypothetical protein E4K67_09075 [Desulfosporosinus fructosivorans]|uniref:DUF5320 domain-containing protein n=1 Tax=Desulfosporosinus fructosivorans TaxID=2018669 RepID=A0A4Z0R4U5_9FIRM|nr:DUF5320 domain-containing protein [Desulfosporosinus fructosivorans]TGE38121.1 hypothetical protein E4K67_09075 [Desulfosporosinus fructosivorans]